MSDSLRVRFARWLMRGTSAAAAPVEREPMTVSLMALARANVAPPEGQQAPLNIEDLFVRPKPMAGVIPRTLAMDSAGLPACLPTLAPMASWGIANAIHEGIVFFGFPYLAQLMQRVENRNGAQIWAEHATRKFVEIKGPNDAKVKELETFLGPGEGNLDAKAAFRQMAWLDAGFGRGQIYLDCDDYDRPNELITPLPAKPEKVNKNRPLKRLKVIEPMWSYPGPYETDNPLSPNHFRPKEWYVQGKIVSDSRLLTFVGQEMPDMLKPAYAFSGMSMTQSGKPYVDNWLRARQSVSDLLNSFSMVVLSTDMSSAAQDGGELFNRIDLFNKTRTNRGTMVVNNGDEELTNLAVPLSTTDALLTAAQMQMAAAWRIPLSIFLQITPTGLNANSEGEIRSFYDDIHAYQERVFRPNFHRLMEYAMLSLWGAIDTEITFEFPNLWQMSKKEESEIQKAEAETDQIYINTGVVSPDETRERLKSDEDGLYRGVNLNGEAPGLPDDAENDNDPDTQVEAAE